MFRLPEHMQRLLDSAKIYRMDLPFTLEELCAGVVSLIEANGITPCYIRPIALRGYGEGRQPQGYSPVEVYMANFPWGNMAATAERTSASQAGTALRPTLCPPWPRPEPTT